MGEPEQRELTDSQIEALANYLRGTAGSIDGALEALEMPIRYEVDMTYADCLMLDSKVFCCTICDWWCGADEHGENEGDDFVCAECVDN